MTDTFPNWTEYDDWLIANYDKYSIYKLEDNNGSITIEYVEKSEFNELKKQKENEEQKKAKGQ